MTQTSSSKLFTFEEYLAYEGSDTRTEWVDGVLVEMPPESPEDLAIARFLMFELAKHLPLSRIAYNTEIEVSGQRAKARLPDLLVHTEESLAALTGSTRATVTRDMPPPAIAIEVVSPGAATRARDYRYKRTEYAAREIAEYWIIDPEEQRLTICQWVEGQYEDKILTGGDRIESGVVPAIALTANQVFAVGS